MYNSRNYGWINTYNHIIFQDNDMDIRHKSQKKNEKDKSENCTAKRKDKNW